MVNNNLQCLKNCIKRTFNLVKGVNLGYGFWDFHLVMLTLFCVPGLPWIDLIIDSLTAINLLDLNLVSRSICEKFTLFNEILKHRFHFVIIKVTGTVHLSQSNTAVHFVVQTYLKVTDRINLHSSTNLHLCDLI